MIILLCPARIILCLSSSNPPEDGSYYDEDFSDDSGDEGTATGEESGDEETDDATDEEDHVETDTEDEFQGPTGYKKRREARAFSLRKSLRSGKYPEFSRH